MTVSVVVSIIMYAVMRVVGCYNAISVWTCVVIIPVLRDPSSITVMPVSKRGELCSPEYDQREKNS